MTTDIDLSADLGESFGHYRIGNDEALFEVISSANIACGFHAGDPRVMEQSVAKCVDRGVAIGAHPGFPDIVGFGRRAMDLSPDEVRTDVLYQIGALHGFARAVGRRVTHVSPHGKLGNMVVDDRRYADAVSEAVTAFDPELMVYTYEGALADASRRRGLRVIIIGFADRAYRDDGTLVPRSEPNALITQPDEVVSRVITMLTQGLVTSASGTAIPIKCQSILLHGDTPGSVDLGNKIRSALADAGIRVRAPSVA
jgi:UPF0271 protein